MFGKVFCGRRVLVTGHTGFKGSWLSTWLGMAGARVSGLALEPNEDQRLFDSLGLTERLWADHRVDVRDGAAVMNVVERERPEFVFHLAAQPLVRLSYAEPAATIETNVMGVTNVLDAVRRSGRPCVVVVVTSDKCYENREIDYGYAEDDRLGGHDPYSASKACAELIVASFRQSFFCGGAKVKLASARAGNVIGGGDWSRDRIMPDAIRALRSGEPIRVRNKVATRPWQHVLEPLSGYLWLAATMDRPALVGQVDEARLCDGFNFGPTIESNRTVAELVEEVLKNATGSWIDASESAAPHEAGKLHLAIDKAREVLGWRPVWDFESTVRETVAWYEAEARGDDVRQTTEDQISRYRAATTAIRTSQAA